MQGVVGFRVGCVEFEVWGLRVGGLRCGVRGAGFRV